MGSARWVGKRHKMGGEESERELERERERELERERES